MTTHRMTVGELRRWVADAPDNASVLLVLHTPGPAAGWLGRAIYDADSRTLDLHDTDVHTPGDGTPAVEPDRRGAVQWVTPAPSPRPRPRPPLEERTP